MSDNQSPFTTGADGVPLSAGQKGESTPATGAHAAAMAYMDAQRRDMDRVQAARNRARMNAQTISGAPEPEGLGNGHAPSDSSYHIQELGMFTRPETQSINDAANRDNVSDDSFKGDLVPQANSAESDRDRDYSRDNDNAGVAYTHMDLQQSNVSVFEDILCRLRTNTQAFLGQAGFHNDFSGTNSPPDAPGNNVTLHNGNFRDQASGGQHGLAHPVGHKPAQHDEYHSAPLSATPSNGSHSTRGSVTSNAVKAETKLDIMKRTQRVIG